MRRINPAIIRVEHITLTKTNKDSLYFKSYCFFKVYKEEKNDKLYPKIEERRAPKNGGREMAWKKNINGISKIKLVIYPRNVDL